MPGSWVVTDGGSPSSGDVADLRRQLSEALGTAQGAYRDSAALIRLLAVIGEATPPGELIDRALGVLSETFHVDICCFVRRAVEDWEVVAARGFAEDELPRLPRFPDGVDILSSASASSWTAPAGLSAVVGDVEITSAAFIPLSSQAEDVGAILLLRSDRVPFGSANLQLLQSVALRLRSSLDEGARRLAMERLLRSGHRFSRHLSLTPLLEDAVEVLREMTGAQWAAAATVEGQEARCRCHSGILPGGRPWPRLTTSLAGWPNALRGEYSLQQNPPSPWCADAGDWEAGSVLCVPVLDGGVPLALLYAGHERPRFFAGSVAETAPVLAGYVGAAMVNARLYKALAKSEAHLRLLTQELSTRATHDTLTGLANRDLARQVLEDSLGAHRDDLVGLLFCDLDKFKSVNDRLGHEAGDDLLRQVAGRVGGCTRPGDVLARLGGDEFVLVLSSVPDLPAVRRLGQRILDALDEPFQVGQELIRVTASLGGVVSRREGGPARATELLRDADAAMYVAKARGRGRVEVFDDETARDAVDRLALREDLIHALARGQLDIHYQGIVELHSGAVRGFEALLRWHHPRMGSVPPDVFVPIAEETGAIVGIGSWVLERACRQLVEWKRLPTAQQLSVSINVSRVELLDSHYAAHVLDTVRRTGVDPHDVCLEVTESVEISDRVLDQLRTLRDAGVRLVLDDFGTSYSNLAYLKRLPLQGLKIDRSFVAGLAAAADADQPHPNGSGIDAGIVRAIQAIADSAGLDVTAEGIETRQQRDTLTAMGCRWGQGYLFARPVPVGQATMLLVSPPRSAVTDRADQTSLATPHGADLPRDR